MVMHRRVTLTEKHDPKLKRMDLNQPIISEALKAIRLPRMENTGQALNPYLPYIAAAFSHSFAHIVARQTLFFHDLNPTSLATSIRDSFFYGMGIGPISDRPSNWRELEDAPKKLDRLNQELVKRGLPSLKKILGFDPREFFSPSLQGGNADVYDENASPNSATIENGTRYAGFFDITVFGVAETQEGVDGTAGGVEGVLHFPFLRKIVNFCRYLGFIQAVGEDEELKQAVTLAMGAWLAYSLSHDPSIAAQERSKGALLIQDTIKYNATSVLTWPALRRVIVETLQGRLKDEMDISYTGRHALRLLAQSTWYFIGEAESQRKKAPPVYLLLLAYIITMPVDRQVFIKLFLPFFFSSLIHHIRYTRKPQGFGFWRSMIVSPAINLAIMPESMKGINALFPEKWEFGPFQTSRSAGGKGAAPIQSKNLLHLYAAVEGLAFATGALCLYNGLQVGEYTTQIGLMINIFWQGYAMVLTSQGIKWQKNFERYEEYVADLKGKIPPFMLPPITDRAPTETELIRLRVQALEALAQTQKLVEEFRHRVDVPKSFIDFLTCEYQQSVFRYLYFVETGIVAKARERLAKADLISEMAESRTIIAKEKKERDENLGRGIVLLQVLTESSPLFSVVNTAHAILREVKIDAKTTDKDDAKLVTQTQKEFLKEYQGYCLQTKGLIPSKQLTGIRTAILEKLIAAKILEGTHQHSYSWSKKYLQMEPSTLKGYLRFHGATSAEINILQALHQQYRESQPFNTREETAHLLSYHALSTTQEKTEMESSFLSRCRNAGLNEWEAQSLLEIIKNNADPYKLFRALLSAAAPKAGFNHLCRIALKEWLKQHPEFLTRTTQDLKTELQNAAASIDFKPGLIDQINYLKNLDKAFIYETLKKAGTARTQTFVSHVASIFLSPIVLSYRLVKSTLGFIFKGIPGTIPEAYSDTRKWTSPLWLRLLLLPVALTTVPFKMIREFYLFIGRTVLSPYFAYTDTQKWIASRLSSIPQARGIENSKFAARGKLAETIQTTINNLPDNEGNPKDFEKILNLLKSLNHSTTKPGQIKLLKKQFDMLILALQEKAKKNFDDLLRKDHSSRKAPKEYAKAINAWQGEYLGKTVNNKYVPGIVPVKHEYEEFHALRNIPQLTTIPELFVASIIYAISIPFSIVNLAYRAISNLWYGRFRLIKGITKNAGAYFKNLYFDTYHSLAGFVLPFNYHFIDKVPHSKAFNQDCDEIMKPITEAWKEIRKEISKEIIENALKTCQFDPENPDSEPSKKFVAAIRETYMEGYEKVYEFLKENSKILDDISKHFTDQIMAVAKNESLSEKQKAKQMVPILRKAGRMGFAIYEKTEIKQLMQQNGIEITG